MFRFFQRIFISVWIALIFTLLVTLVVASLLPAGESTNGELYFQVSQKVAQDLMVLNQSGGITDEQIIDRHILDYGNLMQVYVITPKGREILNRSLPENIDAANQLSPARFDTVFFSEGLGGYIVIGFQKTYPFWRAMLQPGARLILLLAALLSSILIAYALSRFVIRPITRLRHAGQKVASGDLSVRVAHTVEGRNDDIALLARDFDVMTERVSELISTQRRLMRDVSHELRSPLARLQAMLSIARQKLEQTGGQVDQSLLFKMEVEAERLNTMIEEILKFARLDVQVEINKHKTDLVDLMNVIAEDALIEWPEDEKDVLLEGDDALIVDVDSVLIHSAFENVVRNALRYTMPNTKVTIHLQNTDGMAKIDICDQGPGVPEESLESLFDPFYRVEEARIHQMGGGGVGLAIAERSIKLHGGSIHAENIDTGGLKVSILLPILS